MNEKIAQAVRELQACKAEEARILAVQQEASTKAHEARNALCDAQGKTEAARTRLLQVAEGVADAR
jgi:hypothetical protein